MHSNLLSTAQPILGVILIALIILQSKGTGLGSTFGGELGLYQTRRGVEKILFLLTIVVAGLFIICSIVGLIL